MVADDEILHAEGVGKLRFKEVIASLQPPKFRTASRAAIFSSVDGHFPPFLRPALGR